MIVALIGSDGSGKTYHTKRLFKKWAFMNPILVKPFQRLFILEYLLKLLPRKKARDNYLGGKKSFLFRIYPFLVLIDQYLHYLYLKMRGRRLILFDRYAYSFLICWEYYGVSNKLLRWLYLRFPKPDLLLMIDTSLDICHKRRGGDKQYYVWHDKKNREIVSLLGGEIRKDISLKKILPIQALEEHRQKVKRTLSILKNEFVFKTTIPYNPYPTDIDILPEDWQKSFNRYKKIYPKFVTERDEPNSMPSVRFFGRDDLIPLDLHKEVWSKDEKVIAIEHGKRNGYLTPAENEFLTGKTKFKYFPLPKNPYWLGVELYRRIKYFFTGQLPFHKNWLKEER